MKRKRQKTLEAIYARPISANILWRDIESLFLELGAEISEREGSRAAGLQWYFLGRFVYFIDRIQILARIKVQLPVFVNG